MSYLKLKGVAALTACCLTAYGEAGSPNLDYFSIKDPRIFNLSTTGTGQLLEDGPVTTATLGITEGAKGALVASFSVEDLHGDSWGPVMLKGKLKVSGTGPLTFKLSGKGSAKVQLTGIYDARVQTMQVIARVKSPTGESFQWNDGFVPVNAHAPGFTVLRNSTASNINGVIKGSHEISIPGAASWTVKTTASTPDALHMHVQGKGVSLFGDYNPLTDITTFSEARFSVGYGTILTPGSLATDLAP